ncbi:MAG: hypothetical protein KAG53_01490 [Endozoicomonadaceae bacterium]|nr:hypothetical protein [Endozoicomonadaceae bacterium]
MNYSVTDSTTKTAIDSNQSSSNLGVSGNYVIFAKGCFRAGLIATTTVCFPLIMGEALVSELHHSYGDNTKSMTVKIKRAVAPAMFAMPVLGPIVVRQCFDELIVHGKVIISKDAMKDNSYFRACIPFVSSLMMSLAMDSYFFGWGSGRCGGSC